ncbi:MAG: PilT/PilU family type 4a pilus ATPase [Sandaracinaceae bacterium]|nr:PilT/PilU family type 4a pilus ATPase [Sandaracinaceae bacterium]
MFAAGLSKRLAVPSTSDETLRDLLGDLVAKAVNAGLFDGKEFNALHEVPKVGIYRVAISARGDQGGFDVVFRAGATAPAPALSAAPAVLPPANEGSAAREALDTAGITRLLARALDLGASDLHLSAGEPPTIRVSGSLSRLMNENAVNVDALVLPLLDARAQERLQQGVSVDFALDVTSAMSLHGAGECATRVRGNAYRTAKGLAAAFRLLPPAAPSLDALTASTLLHELASLPNGLVVVCGPTGCGKSTTLAALARETVRRRSVMLLTLEDPIEYSLDGIEGARSLVRQRQIGRDVRDFATGLRDALREDPDVILVGEMRDAESISLALTAAETGHLVLTTLHSRSAASAIERIVDTYPEGRQSQIRAQLADSLRAVVSQRLVPCANREGRVLALEVLRMTASVANGLREGKISVVTSAMQSGKRDGMIVLEKFLAELVRKGEISASDAQAAANDRDALLNYQKNVS